MMAGLKRRLILASQNLDGLSADHRALMQAHDALVKEHDLLIALIVALGRDAQERRLFPKPLRVPKALAYDPARTQYHLETSEDESYVTIKIVKAGTPVMAATSETVQ